VNSDIVAAQIGPSEAAHVQSSAPVEDCRHSVPRINQAATIAWQNNDFEFIGTHYLAYERTLGGCREDDETTSDAADEAYFWRTAALLEAADAQYLTIALRRQNDDNVKMSELISALVHTANVTPAFKPDPAWKIIVDGVLSAPRPVPPPTDARCLSLYIGNGMTTTNCR
jgi:hypothetical protein